MILSFLNLQVLGAKGSRKYLLLQNMQVIVCSNMKFTEKNLTFKLKVPIFKLELKAKKIRILFTPWLDTQIYKTKDIF